MVQYEQDNNGEYYINTKFIPEDPDKMSSIGNTHEKNGFIFSSLENILLKSI